MHDPQYLVEINQEIYEDLIENQVKGSFAFNFHLIIVIQIYFFPLKMKVNP